MALCFDYCFDFRLKLKGLIFPELEREFLIVFHECGKIFLGTQNFISAKHGGNSSLYDVVK